MLKDITAAKNDVREFWDTSACGERIYLDGDSLEAYQRQLASRYETEPFIPEFATFAQAFGKRVLEIGVGLGADHQRFAEFGAQLSGIDLTERAIDHTTRRFELFGLESDLSVADAEHLPVESHAFDLIYSWGVIHHSPDTEQAINEIYRALRKGGQARVMIYHKYSLVGLMLWIRYALLELKPWISLRHVYSNYLESPGTKAYTMSEARRMFGRFDQTSVSIELSVGDLLQAGAGQRHRSRLLSAVRKLWPRWLIRRCFKRFGLFMLIKATK